MFDKIIIMIKSGDGGNGAVSFRREAHVPYGGPDGGNGGNGGSVRIQGDSNIISLRNFRDNKLYAAGRGVDGKNKKQYGKRGLDLLIKVPEGTVALAPDGTVLADCSRLGAPVTLAWGGKGGKGNIHYVSSTNQAPRLAERGEPGIEMSITLEIRTLADVGIIGFPNAGKSTLLTAVSAAEPKIASYPFTTLEPVLGVVETEKARFIIAEIPGLIEGAHLGKGLGHDFLRHALRTLVLVHLVDGSSENPLEDVVKLNMELSLFDTGLSNKAQIIAVNKVDKTSVESRQAEIEREFQTAGMKVIFVSGARGDGVTELIDEIIVLLEKVKAQLKAEESEQKAIFHPAPPKRRSTVRKEGDVFVVESTDLERLISRVDINDTEVRRQMDAQMEQMGLVRALEAAGALPGDMLRCGDYEWEW